MSYQCRMGISEDLFKRAGEKCELCASNVGLEVMAVAPKAGESVDDCVLLCAVCRQVVQGHDLGPTEHWYCIRESIWSEIPAVQVVSARVLARLSAESWAMDLRGQLYFSPEVEGWIEAENAAVDPAVITSDSNGTELRDGDSVTLIKDLAVKGAGFTAKRGTLVKNIRLIGDPENIEGRVNKIDLVLKTKFLKKA